MLPKILDRKKHYEDLGGESNVILEDLQVMKHCQIPNAYFIHAKYLVGSGGTFKPSEVFETLDEKGEWVDMRKTLNDSEYEAFLKDCAVCNL
jgi:hypothetical protein